MALVAFQAPNCKACRAASCPALGAERRAGAGWGGSAAYSAFRRRRGCERRTGGHRAGSARARPAASVGPVHREGHAPRLDGPLSGVCRAFRTAADSFSTAFRPLRLQRRPSPTYARVGLALWSVSGSSRACCNRSRSRARLEREAFLCARGASAAQRTSLLRMFLTRVPSATTACTSAAEQAPSAPAISIAAQASQASQSAMP